MTQPKSLDARVTELEAKLGQMQSALSAFTVRFTAAEETLSAGQPRLTTLEEAARGFESRVKALESVSHSPSNADAHRLAAVEATVTTLTNIVTQLSQVSRPGRSVVREQLSSLQEQVAQILSRLPQN